MSTELVGVAVLGLALVVYCWAVWLFFTTGHGTPLPAAPPDRFVAQGPYRYTRNPMAISVVSAAVGASLLGSSLVGLGATVLLALGLHAYIRRREEPVLVERFGDSYLAYCEEVPRWLIGRSAPGDTAA